MIMESKQDCGVYVSLDALPSTTVLHHQQQQQQQQQQTTSPPITTPNGSSSGSSSISGGNKRTSSGDSDDSGNSKDVNCSYTAMIAQAIMRMPFKRATLSEIYTFMTNAFEILKKRGNGWRNCVRHTLSLNECFVKLNRPENGRSCNWTIHPSYFDSFGRGDYRKRRSNRKKMRSSVQPWGMLEQQRYFSCYGNQQQHCLPPYLPQSPATSHQEIPPSVNELGSHHHQPQTTHPVWQNYLGSLENTSPPLHRSIPTTSQEFPPAAYSNMVTAQSNHHSYGNETLHHKQHPATTNSHSPVQQPPPQSFPVNGYTSNSSNSPTHEYGGGHLSPPNNNIADSQHIDRFRYHRSPYAAGYSPYQQKISDVAEQRTHYEQNYNAERTFYDRPLPSCSGYSQSPHFLIDNPSYYGSVTSRPFKTEYM